ncbi:MAG: methylenetetrahydrofolate reductase [Actinobacteria bacterium]|nr:methylenetetrahydrofolate reductase [Actinomycetota bacterium]
MPGGLVELLRRPRYEVFPLPGIEDELAEHVPTDVKVTVTSSPKRGLEATLRLSADVARRGFDVVPHVAARLVAGEAHLREIFDTLREIGVREIFVIAGDAEEPAGTFAGAADLLAAMDELGHPFDDIGISGYPESHPFIRDEATIQAMFDKAPFASYIVSQLCLDPGVIAWWIDAVRERGVDLPIHVGIPGVTPRRKLLRIATRIGVGESVRFVRTQGNVIARLLLGGSVGPHYLLDGLAPQVGRIAGFHVYTFNELGETERWRQAMLERLADSATA